MIRVSRTVGFTLCAVVIGLQGCSEIQKAVGNTKQAPDEFAVVARPPLSVPPNFALRPPTPGEPRPQERDVTKSAERLVLGNGNQSTVFGTAGNVPWIIQEIHIVFHLKSFLEPKRIHCLPRKDSVENI